MNGSKLAPLDGRGWLAGQSADFRAWVAGNGRWRVFGPGRVLYGAGEDPDGLYGLGSGALEVTFPLVGDEVVTVHRAEVGFWIGESALLARTTRLLSIEAAAEARVFFVPAAAIRALVADQPEQWQAFFELSHINVSTAVTLLAEALALSPRARVARVLLRLADAEGRVEVRQDELARLIGMTRSSLQRTLQNLSESAVLSRGYGCLLVLDRARLEAISMEA